MSVITCITGVGAKSPWHRRRRRLEDFYRERACQMDAIVEAVESGEMTFEMGIFALELMKLPPRD